MNIAIIAPQNRDDYLLNDCIDGLFELAKEKPDIAVGISEGLIHPFPQEKIEAITLDEQKFVRFAIDADIIILTKRKDATNFRLAEKIGRWKKTVFLDGSELGKNARYDHNIQKEVLDGTYKGNGAIDLNMLQKCAAYFRREKPYLPGITPFPYSIQSSYPRYFDAKKEKDIDFICIFGQDEFPIMRRHAVSILEDYCMKNGFTFRTKRTKGFDFSLERKAGREEFYELLARSKVGISIGGGGFDTVRFWETLANNCLLLTERIDIFPVDTTELKYERIYQFNNLYDFKDQLQKIGSYLRSSYAEHPLEPEYEQIMSRHSSKARVDKLISVAMEKIVESSTA